MQRVTTIQDVSDIKSLIETSNIKFDFNIPKNYLNYLKLCVDPTNKVDDFSRPIESKLLEHYDIEEEDIFYKITIPKGDCITIVYPDVIFTDEMKMINNKFKLYNGVIYNRDTKSIKLISIDPISLQEVELYRNIATFFKFPNVETKTCFELLPIKCMFGSCSSDIRLLALFDNIDKINFEYLNTKKTDVLRYITPLRSLDQIGYTDNEPIDFVDVDATAWYKQATELRYKEVSLKEIETKIGMKARLASAYLNAIGRSKMLKDASTPLVPCIVMRTSFKQDTDIEVTTKYECMIYNENKINPIMIDQEWLPIVEDIVQILKICYNMNVKQIINMLIKNNGISLAISKQKDRNYLNNIVNGKNYSKILSVFVQLWQTENPLESENS
jgi:hypothetical protein